METKTQVTYNRAKIWQIGLFVLNNTATNSMLLFMGYIGYYANGIAGILVATVGFLGTAMRLFDGITDPIIGYFIDKTNTKFGKFRPAMVIGYVIMVIAILILFNTLHVVPESMRVIWYILIYGLYIIGYTFQTACTKGAQACLTNDPQQRPTFTLFDGIYNTVLFTGMGIFISNVLVPKHNNIFSLEFFHELMWMIFAMAGVMTVLAIIGISGKDRTEYFGLGTKAPEVKFKDYLDVIKHNKAIQMLIVAASTDKLANSTAGNLTVTVILYGILAGNYGLSGQVGGFAMIPTILILALGVQMARKMGQKQALVVFTWIPLIISLALAGLMLFGDMSTLSFTDFNTFSLMYLVLLILMNGTKGVSGNIVIPMIADCADYETYRTGRFVPGMMGTLFSFVDKLISSLATTIVSLAVAAIGFSEVLPQIDTPYSTELHYIGVFLFIGLPVLGWIASLIAMKFYPLTKEKMNEIQVEIDRIKKEA